MTAATLTHLPLAAGGAVLEITGNAIHWGIARYMRAPLANTAILAMVTLTAMAASNALYMQSKHHPSPLFAPFVEKAAVEVQPVIPATRSKKAAQQIAPLPAETTGSVTKKVATGELDNDDVKEIQSKLHSMQVYEGSIDGLFGPRTARAIKTFEQRMGLPVKGQLSQDLLEAVRAAPVILPEEKVEPLPTPEPLPAVTLPKVQATPQAVVTPAEEPEPAPAANEFRAQKDAPTVVKELAPLPTPAPITGQLKPIADTEKPILQREIPQNAEEALDLAARTAGEAIDTIIEGVQTVAMTTQSKKKPVEATQYAAEEPVAQATPIPAAAGEDDRGAIMQTASVDAPQVGVTLAMPAEESTMTSTDLAVLDTDAKPEDLMPAFSVTDPVMVAKVQRGLASLGFLQGAADGVAGEATATAIRRFEVWYNYDVTGRITPELLDLLVANGASI